MNVYKKLANVQNLLACVDFPKSGYNKFGGFKYHELEDILPTIRKTCFENGLFLEFNFTHEEGLLRIRDLEKPDGIVITQRVPMPPLEQLNKKMNIAQSLGSYITYLKRYLLVNTFLIMEKSVIDSTQLSKDSEPIEDVTPKRRSEFVTADKDSKLPADDNIASCIESLKRLLQKEEKPITERNLIQRAIELKREGVITPEVCRAVRNVIKKGDVL